jgi:replicative DNA helicase
MYNEYQGFHLQMPQNIEAEQAVLGAILIDPEVLPKVKELLSSSDFYRKTHQMIYDAILVVAESDEPVDLITVTAELQNAGRIDDVGGVAYLSSLANSVPTAANADHYATIVKEKSIQRLVITTSQQTAAAVMQGEDALTAMEEAKRRFQEIDGQNRRDDGFAQIKNALFSAMEQIEINYQNRKSGHQISGTPTGYDDLDRILDGTKPNQLIIIAARPAVGKTAFALNIAQNVAIRQKKTVGIFSMEMSKDQLAMRMLCAEGNIDAGRLRSGDIDDDDWPKITMTMGVLGEAPIFIDDKSDNTIEDIRRKARKLKEKHPDLAIIVVDYLQLISGSKSGKGANRQQEVSEISRQLKVMSGELGITVIALSQLSRSVEQRADKRPMLSDLRESGSIEQDADIVAFLYREDYYQPDTDKKNIVEVIIAKQRSGPTGTVELVFLKNFNKFVNLERAPGA